MVYRNLLSNFLYFTLFSINCTRDVLLLFFFPILNPGYFTKKVKKNALQIVISGAWRRIQNIGTEHLYSLMVILIIYFKLSLSFGS